METQRICTRNVKITRTQSFQLVVSTSSSEVSEQASLFLIPQAKLTIRWTYRIQRAWILLEIPNTNQDPRLRDYSRQLSILQQRPWSCSPNGPYGRCSDRHGCQGGCIGRYWSEQGSCSKSDDWGWGEPHGYRFGFTDSSLVSCCCRVSLLTITG